MREFFKSHTLLEQARILIITQTDSNDVAVHINWIRIFKSFTEAPKRFCIKQKELNRDNLLYTKLDPEKPAVFYLGASKYTIVLLACLSFLWRM